ncbi:efflux transporter periplasmic adaptor subunit [Sulfitobacter sp. SK012]|uniref:efflux RND transporter periplasmic adaptor subunit n=1 Tax=Sulfitobacter sp. SK012 TaxID=1389005 RepID=UPI000E0CAA07|nr:efflux RND transporter periplasmic adaptor subunit [Sulfitobacter sp. SK012]AXI45570.1 efflux transporter periplasmic adaptor subunit [Sulfitobacter sp. SK012]
MTEKRKLPAHRMWQMKLGAALLAATCLLGLPAQAQQSGAEKPKVVIAAAYSEEIRRETTFVGRGEASAKVDLIPQVTGTVTQIVVEDGTAVKAGDLIYTIDPASYEAAVAAESATIKRAKANLLLAQIELKRKQELLSRDVISESELDVAEANESVAEADVAATQAALQKAELDLERTEIKAPFDGRIGKSSVSLGALVGPTSGALSTLVQQSPMYVTFSLSEPQLLRVVEQLDTGMEALLANDVSPNVLVSLSDGTILDEPGEIVFIDNGINPSTGTISIRAEFENKRQMILDGSFVSVIIEALEPTLSVLIPQNAVQRDQRGDFVLVVTDQQLVEQRYIVLGPQVESAMIVSDGLRAGESVIVEGLQRVRPGAEVNAVLSGTTEGN